MNLDLLMAAIRQEKLPGYEWIGIGMGLIIVSVMGGAAVAYWLHERGKTKPKKKKRR